MDKKEVYKTFHDAKALVRKDKAEEAEKLLADVFDDNCYGEGFLVFGKTKMVIESIWTDNDDCNKLKVHVNDKWFEGDLYFRTLSRPNQLRTINTMCRHTIGLIQNGITI